MGRPRPPKLDAHSGHGPKLVLGAASRFNVGYRLPLRQFIGGEGRGEVVPRLMGGLGDQYPNGAPASKPAFDDHEPKVWFDTLAHIKLVNQSTRQIGVAAVAERSVLGMFAAAPSHRLGFRDVHLCRGETGAFVGSVAERLIVGFTATAPIIGVGLGGLNKRSFAGDFWFTHKISLPSRSWGINPEGAHQWASATGQNYAVSSATSGGKRTGKVNNRWISLIPQ